MGARWLDGSGGNGGFSATARRFVGEEAAVVEEGDATGGGEGGEAVRGSVAGRAWLAGVA